METGRLEAFADGVFAIAATLLIIDVTVRAPGAGLGHAVVHAWPEYAAYIVSFVTIGIMWINHHTCMRLIGAADRTFMVINLFLLMCIAFVPFPTNLIAEHLHDSGLRAAALTYGVNLTVTACFFNLFWFYAARGRRLIAPEADEGTLRGLALLRPGRADVRVRRRSSRSSARLHRSHCSLRSRASTLSRARSSAARRSPDSVPDNRGGGDMSGYAITRLDEINAMDDGRVPMRPVRHHLGITAFGVNGWTADAGGRIINEHTEDDPDSQEEL